jgi:hypothetical protein
MSVRLLFTIFAVVAVLFGLAFVLFPTASSSVYGVPPDPNTMLNAQFFGSGLLAIGVVNWFARDFRDWDAIRGVLIADIVGCVVGGAVNLIGTFGGLLNGMAWTTTIIYALLLIGAGYCLANGPQTSGAARTA